MSNEQEKKEPEKKEDDKHSKERREIIKAAASMALLPYVAPAIKTFFLDTGLDVPVPQGQRGRARIAALLQAGRQAYQSGLRGQALLQAALNLFSP